MPPGRISICALLVASLLGLPGVAHGKPASEPVFRYTDVDEAWEAAQQSQRPILVFISGSGCRFCRRMLQETYHHPQIAEGIRRGFEAVSVVREQQPELVRQLGIRSFPTTLVVSPQGELIARIDGFADPQQFSTQIRSAMVAHSEAHRTAATPPAATHRSKQ